MEDLEGRIAAYINTEYPSGRLYFVEQACSSRHVLHIKYRSIRGQETERMIEPIGITFYRQSWHVIAYCRLREDYRDFSLTRITKLKDTVEIMTTRCLTLDAYIEKIQSDQQD